VDAWLTNAPKRSIDSFLQKETIVFGRSCGARKGNENVRSRMQNMVVMKAHRLPIAVIDHFAAGWAPIGLEFLEGC
jgi:hypothetical protein